MVIYTNVSYTDKKRAARRRWKIRIALFFSFLALTGLGYFIFFTNFFRFKEVKITGNKILEESDIFPGSRLPFYWENIAITHYGLDKVEIKKDFIKGILAINVEERMRYGIWCKENASSEAATASSSGVTVARGAEFRCLWFDPNGVLFAPAPTVEGMLIPKVRDLSLRDLKIGDSVLEERFLANLFKIFEIFKKADISIADLKIDDSTHEEIEAELLAGPKIYFSTRFDPSFAFMPLHALQQKFPRLSYIDFRAENKVYYK